MMRDPIERQDAIDAFDGVKVDEECCTEYDIGYNDGIDFAVSKLSVLPSAQPESQWIPVSERLPDMDEDGYSDLVLVSFSNFSVPAILEYRKGDNDWYEQTEADGEPGVSGIGLVVNAWRPLPESYKGDKDDE